MTSTAPNPYAAPREVSSGVREDAPLKLQAPLRPALLGLVGVPPLIATAFVAIFMPTCWLLVRLGYPIFGPPPVGWLMVRFVLPVFLPVLFLLAGLLVAPVVCVMQRFRRLRPGGVLFWGLVPVVAVSLCTVAFILEGSASEPWEKRFHDAMVVFFFGAPAVVGVIGYSLWISRCCKRTVVAAKLDS